MDGINGCDEHGRKQGFKMRFSELANPDRTYLYFDLKDKTANTVLCPFISQEKSSQVKNNNFNHTSQGNST